MKTGKTLTELAAEIESQRARKVDFVAPTSRMEARVMQPDEGPEKIRLAVEGFEDTYPMKELALSQAAARVGLPAKYMAKMRDEYPQLLADNLNGWFNFKPERRMVRALDGKARAFLSDSFRRIDNFDIATAAIPVLYDFKGIEFRSMEITENRMYIKATLPSLQREIKSARVGDVVEAGIMLTNSEVGLGMWSVSPYALYLWCLNGASREGGKKWRHVGGKIGGEDMQYLAEDTVKASDKVDLMVMRDTIRNALSEASFEKWIESVQETTAQPITGRVSAAIEVLSEKLVLNSGEADNVLQHLIRGGDMSRYGLMNAVTRTAEDAVDYDRATQFEAFGQTIIDLPANEWREIAEAA